MATLFFTDLDVAQVLAVVDRDRSTTRAYDAVTAAGMDDDVYQSAFGWALRTGLLVVTGQHSEATRKGRRYVRRVRREHSRPDHLPQDRDVPAWPATTDDFDLPRRTL